MYARLYLRGLFYFKNMTDQPEINHRAYTLNHIPDTYITSTLKYLAENSVSFPKLFVKNTLEPCIRGISKLFISHKK